MANLLGDALFTKTQQRILALLYGRSGQSFYLNEIVRLAAMGKGTIARELKRMHAAGLITATKVGNQVRFQANPECPIFRELIGIVRKTFGIVAVLEEALQPATPQIQFAFVYGEVAAGKGGQGSDIDLMVIADSLSYAGILELLIPAEKTLGRVINPTIFTQREFRQKRAIGNQFLERVLRQPFMPVVGTQEVLGDVLS